MGAGNAGGGNSGGGSPNQMAKDKAKRDKAKRDAIEKAKITFTPKDDNRDKQKVIVPSKKPADYNIEKDDTGVKKSIEDAKKTPVVMPKDDGGQGSGAETKPVVPVVPKPIVPVVPKPITPTEAEVSQSAATDVVEDTIETRKKKTKAKGRSATILSSARGVRSDEGLTLGKRSLLGS